MSEPREPNMEPPRPDASDRSEFDRPAERELSTAELAEAPASTADQAAARPQGESRSFAGDGARGHEPMFPTGDADELRRAWDDIQAGFVDEPRKAVEAADHLVAQTMQRLAESFADERARLEGQWDRGDNVSTEELRVAFTRYRAFFGRLLEA